ncbi:MAG: GNAT family N-acetyltransferase [Candidatus Muirbacterium halophilum]|nr:GNAT family N-acetyltransferase [Candidatus Muirbacterium halophilum]MCK9476151.1 GNAT family N-acetyltransferase [Candidatus Muirbacterium halophilum]
MFEIKKLNNKEIIDYSILLNQNKNSIKQQNSHEYIYFASLLFGKKAGIIKAFKNNKDNIITIEYIFVIKKFRKKGLGSILIQHILDYAKENSINKINIKYYRILGKTHEIEYVLKKLKFSKPQMINLSCYSDARVINKKWLIEDKIPKEFKFFMWKDITLNIKNQIKNHEEKEKWIELMLNPLEKIENIEYTNSVGLLYKNKIAGWIICQRLSEDVILYRNLYVLQKFRSLARGIQLLNHSIKLQSKTNIKHGLWVVAGNNILMKNFVKRRMAKDCIYIKEEMGSWVLV